MTEIYSRLADQVKKENWVKRRDWVNSITLFLSLAEENLLQVAAKHVAKHVANSHQFCAGELWSPYVFYFLSNSLYSDGTSRMDCCFLIWKWHLHCLLLYGSTWIISLSEPSAVLSGLREFIQISFTPANFFNTLFFPSIYVSFCLSR